MGYADYQNVVASEIWADGVKPDGSDIDTATAAIKSAAHGNAALKALLDAILAAVDTEVAAILAAVDTEVAAIKAKTDNLPAAPMGRPTTNFGAHAVCNGSAYQDVVNVAGKGILHSLFTHSYTNGIVYVKITVDGGTPVYHLMSAAGRYLIGLSAVTAEGSSEATYAPASPVTCDIHFNTSLRVESRSPDASGSWVIVAMGQKE